MYSDIRMYIQSIVVMCALPDLIYCYHNGAVFLLCCSCVEETLSMSLTKMATSLSVIHQEVAISSEADTNYKVCTYTSDSVHTKLYVYSMYSLTKISPCTYAIVCTYVRMTQVKVHNMYVHLNVPLSM